MPVPDVVCCNLPYNSQVPRPHQHAAQLLLDAISSFQAQRPEDIGSELISIDILPATSCIARHTCAFLRFANPAVHREAVKQLYGAVSIDKYALRFELAQRAPQPLTSDTTWRLDRIPPPQATPTVRVSSFATLPLRPCSIVTKQPDPSQPPSTAQRGTVAVIPSCSATCRPGPSSSINQAPDIEEKTTRARSATPTTSTPPKLAPNLLAKYAKSSTTITSPAARPTTTMEQQFAALTLEWQALMKKQHDLTNALTSQDTRHAQEVAQLKAEHSAALAKVRLDMAAEQGDHARLARRLRHERDKAIAEMKSAENRCCDLTDRLDQLRLAHDATLNALHPHPRAP